MTCLYGRRPMWLPLLATLAMALLVPAGRERGAGPLRQRRRKRGGHHQGRGARRDRDPHQQGHQPRARNHVPQRRHLFVRQRAARDLHRPGRSRGIQGVPAGERAGLGQRRQPRGRRAGGGAAHRGRHRPVGAEAAADRLGLSHRRAEVRGDREPAARELPQLPEPPQPRARDDARAVPERRHGHPRPRADHQRQRHRPQQQQHPARRHHQRLHLAPAPRGLRGARGDGGHGEHLDGQLRRRAGDGGGRRGQRADQVRHQRVPRLRFRPARGRGAPGAQLLQLRREDRQPAQHRRGHPGWSHHQEQAVLLRGLGRDVRDDHEYADGDASDGGPAGR